MLSSVGVVCKLTLRIQPAILEDERMPRIKTSVFLCTRRKVNALILYGGEILHSKQQLLWKPNSVLRTVTAYLKLLLQTRKPASIIVRPKASFNLSHGCLIPPRIQSLLYGPETLNSVTQMEITANTTKSNSWRVESTFFFFVKRW